jgi:hypothetical protein
VRRFWIIFAAVFALAALLLFLRGAYEKAFIAATLGAVSWMLSYRVQMRDMVRANEPPDNSTEPDEDE